MPNGEGTDTALDVARGICSSLEPSLARATYPHTVVNAVSGEAVTLAGYRDKYDPAFLPTPVKRLAYTVLAPLGRVFGYEAVHAYVSPPRETGGDIEAERKATPAAA